MTELTHLLGSFDGTLWLGLGTVSFVAWFFSMLAGGGSPLLLIPALTLAIGAAGVAPTLTTGLLVGNGQRSLFFWKHIDWQVTAWYVPGSISGALLGAYAFTQFRAEWLQVFLGGALLIMVLDHCLQGRWQQSSTRFTIRAWHFLPAAFLNAVGSGLIGSTGPVMNPMYLAYGLEKETMIATKSLNKTFLHVVKLASYGVLGAIDGSMLGYGLLIGLAAIPANWLGKWVLARMSSQQFRQVVFAFVAFSGVLMIWGQRDWLGFAVGGI